MNRRCMIALLAASLCAPLLNAGTPVPPLNAAKAGLAVHGYDVVAYFSDGKPVKGLPQYSYRWMDAAWQFSTARNRDAFAANPEKYAPQFGGYCAWAVGHNYTADIDPEAWSIVEGKLYLNYNRGIQQKWQQDRAKWIGQADRNWPGLHK